ncbi:MAG: hypothetical protein PHV75_02710 [Victivallaceae bacterium]|nr:hypothetical protein [Victivallaceae bacterium]NLK82794.1 hypothetical protein [Lentisphaerota bacterium]
MKKIQIVLVVLLLCGMWYGCQSEKAGFTELDNAEQERLLNIIRYNIGSRLTLEQRQLLNVIKPTVKIHYEADKEGKILVSWMIPNSKADADLLRNMPNAIVPMKTINVSGYGVLNVPKSIGWNVSIVDQSRIEGGTSSGHRRVYTPAN